MTNIVEAMPLSQRVHARGLRYFGVELPDPALPSRTPRVSFFREADIGGFYVHGTRPLPHPTASSSLEAKILWLIAQGVGNGRLDAVSGIGCSVSRRKLWAHFGVGALGACGHSGDRLVALMVAHRPVLLRQLAAPGPKLRKDVARILGLPALVSFPRDAKWTASWLGRLFASFGEKELKETQREHLRQMMREAPVPLGSLGYSSATRQASLCVWWGAWLVGIPNIRTAAVTTGPDLESLWTTVDGSGTWRRDLDLAALKRLTLGAEELFKVDLPQGKKET